MIFKDTKQKEWTLTNYFGCGDKYGGGVYYGVFYDDMLLAVSASEAQSRIITGRLGEGYEVQKLYYVGYRQTCSVEDR